MKKISSLILFISLTLTTILFSQEGDLLKKNVKISLVGKYAIGLCTVVAKYKNYIYTNSGSKLIVYDASDISNLVEIGSLIINSRIRELKIHENYLFVIDELNYLKIYDISSPEKPTEVYSERKDWDGGFLFKDEYLFVEKLGSVIIYELKNGFEPDSVAFIEYASNVYIKDNLLFAKRTAIGSKKLVVYDISNPRVPQYINEFYNSEIKGFLRPVVIGNYVYIFYDNAFMVVDASNLDDMRIINKSSYKNVNTYKTAVEGNIIFNSLGNEGIHFIDATNPEKPVYGAILNTGGFVRDLLVKSDTVFVANSDNLKIYKFNNSISHNILNSIENLRDPSEFIVKGSNVFIIDSDLRIYEKSSTFIKEIGGIEAESIKALDKEGQNIYLVQGDKGLRVFDVSDPRTIFTTANYELQNRVRNFKVAGNYVYIANDEGGLKIFDISNKYKPKAVGKYSFNETVFDVDIIDSNAFLAVYSKGLKVVDISDRRQPEFRTLYSLNGNCIDVTAYNNYLFTTLKYKGFKILDVSDIQNIVEVTSDTNYPYLKRIEVFGDYAYLVRGEKGLTILNIADPANPIELGTYNPQRQITGAYVSGNYLYVSLYNLGMRVVDISDPANPVEVGSYMSSGNYHNLFKEGNYVYLANYVFGLEVIDVSTPTSPVKIAHLSTIGNPENVYVDENYGYIANVNGLQIFNTEHPANIKLIDSYGPNYEIMDVKVNGNYAYLACGSTGLEILDCSNPQDLKSLSKFKLNFFGEIEKVWVEDTVAVLLDYDKIGDYNKIRIVTVRDPQNPRLLYSIEQNKANEIILRGNLLFTSRAYSGIKIYDLSNQNEPVLLKTLFEHNYFDDFWVENNYLIVARHNYVYFYDISDPAHIEFGPIILLENDIKRVKMFNDKAYVITRDGVFQEIQINSNSAFNELSKTTVESNRNFTSIKVKNGYAFITDFYNGLVVFDVKNPAEPKQVALLPLGEGKNEFMYIKDERLYVINEMRGVVAIDVSDPENPTEVGVIRSTNNEKNYSVFVYNNYLFIGDEEGLKIKDISDISHPQEVGSFETVEEVFHIYVHNNHAYLFTEYEYIVLDISDISEPIEVFSDSDAPYTNSMVYGKGDTLFVGKYDDYFYGDDNGIIVYDISDPKAIREIGYYKNHLFKGTFEINDYYIYILIHYGGSLYLKTIDISQIAQPIEIDSYEFSCCSYRSLDASENYIYVTQGNDGFSILKNDMISSVDYRDISTPVRFELYQNYPNPFNPSTTIKYSIPNVVNAKFAPTTTKLVIYDVLGREVATLVNKKQSPGNYEVKWNAGKLPSGVYFYRLKYADKVKTRKMLLIK